MSILEILRRKMLMSMHVRPLVENDLKGMTQINSAGTSCDEFTSVINSNYDVSSKTPYKGIAKDIQGLGKNSLIDRSKFFAKTYIRLPISIVNTFSGGIGLSVFSKIINMPGIPKYPVYDVLKIAQGAAVIKVGADGSFIQMYPSSSNSQLNEIYDSEKYKYGGDAIKLILESIDIEERISDYLLTICKTAFRKPALEVLDPLNNKGYSNYASILKSTDNTWDSMSSNKNLIWVVDNYFIRLGSKEFITSGVDSSMYVDTLNGKIDDIRSTLLEGSDLKGELMSKITALLSFRDNRDAIMNQIQNFIVVLPVGYRPDIGRVKDPLTKMYATLFNFSHNLSDLIKTSEFSSVNAIRIAYLEMYDMYMRTCITKSYKDDAKYETIKDKMTGKYGILRLDLQSAVSDYTGRSVITCDYKMSIRNVGVPEAIAVKLCSLEAVEVLRKRFPNKNIDYNSTYWKEEIDRTAIEVMNGKYIGIGRAPTLHLLGFQAFKAIVVKGNSLVLSPGATVAFNADFDGDQMYILNPESKEAKEEMEKLMANVNNPFLPKDGSCHINLRQDMLYGVYTAYNAESTMGEPVVYKTEDDFNEFIVDDLETQRVYIDEPCIVNGNRFNTIGYAMLKLFLGGSSMQKIRLGVVPITTDDSIPEQYPGDKFFEALFRYVKLTKGTDAFVNIVDRYVVGSFTVSNLYAPEIDILQSVDTSELKRKFDDDIKDRALTFNEGFGGEASYNLYYGRRYSELEKEVTSKVMDTLGNENGFVKLVKSGARGNKSNLMQIFGMKGTILKNSAQGFNFVIKSSLSEGLNDFEHFITGFGSREGVIEKVINTFKPGYLSNNIRQIAGGMCITSNDCGTTEGILITPKILLQLCVCSDINVNSTWVAFKEIKDMFIKIVTGRFVLLEGTDGKWSDKGIDPLTEEQASDLFDTRIAKFNYDTQSIEDLGKGVKVRSPMCCEDPCCVHCYGTDILTHKNVVIGTAVGKIAASALTELITQMIMKTFQKGGIAGVVDLTSSFDIISDLLRMYNPSKIKSQDEPIIHDYISPVEGYVHLGESDNGVSRLYITSDEAGENDLLKKKVFMYSGVKVKKHVDRGDTICKNAGIIDVNEVLKIRGADEAQMMILSNLFGIYNKQNKVNFKHFECVVSGMVMMLCLRGHGMFKTGSYYTLSQYHKNKDDKAIFQKMVIGLKKVPTLKTNFLEASLWEDISATTSRNIITSGYDDLTSPIVRTSLGLSLGMGSDVAPHDYVKKRGL